MVCEKCEKKLGTVITPDTWKDGARNTTESGGRKLNENKALTSKKARFDPYGKNKFSTCRICKSSVHQPGSHYCQGCAYKKASVRCAAKGFGYQKLQADFCLDVLMEFPAFCGCTFCCDFSRHNMDVPLYKITCFKMND